MVGLMDVCYTWCVRRIYYVRAPVRRQERCVLLSLTVTIVWRMLRATRDVQTNAVSLRIVEVAQIGVSLRRLLRCFTCLNG